jgi:phosphoribosyl-ATP pyrophosphohydrolase/phosphoribosyl-AMP cyclohydrolase
LSFQRTCYLQIKPKNAKNGMFLPVRNTSSLFAKGINKISQKVGEEAVELVIESKDENKDKFLGEAADLLYHYLVLLQAKNYKLNDVIDILSQRHK